MAYKLFENVLKMSFDLTTCLVDYSDSGSLLVFITKTPISIYISSCIIHDFLTHFLQWDAHLIYPKLRLNQNVQLEAYCTSGDLS